MQHFEISMSWHSIFLTPWCLQSISSTNFTIITFLMLPSSEIQFYFMIMIKSFWQRHNGFWQSKFHKVEKQFFVKSIQKYLYLPFFRFTEVSITILTLFLQLLSDIKIFFNLESSYYFVSSLTTFALHQDLSKLYIITHIFEKRVILLSSFVFDMNIHYPLNFLLSILLLIIDSMIDLH